MYIRMAEYDNIELRSEKVQEIIGKAPVESCVTASGC